MNNMNKKMKQILKEEKFPETSFEIDAIVNRIVDKIKIINNCIIYDQDGTLRESRVNFDRVLKMFGDWTGYEVSCNELRFSRKLINPNVFFTLAEQLSEMLLQKYAKKVVIYIIMHDNEVELRFHVYREKEGLWLDEDLDKYNIPILYYM